MTCPILYSTNPFLKLFINEKFLGDIHYVWCSEAFDSTKLATYSTLAHMPPSSDPCAIYRQLKDDVQRQDKHSAKIQATKASLQSLAIRWRDDGTITDDQMEEIAYMVTNASFDYWRPLVYIIPRDAINARLQVVPPAKRASLRVEYIIPDLRRNEFDIIEL